MGQWRDSGGDGVSNSTIQLAETLASNGHDVIVSGQVNNENADKIQFIETGMLEENSHFDVVIAISFLHYLKALDEKNITFGKSLLWVHYSQCYLWWKGEQLENNGDDIFRDDRMTWVVLQSESQAISFSRKYPYASRKIRLIGNAVGGKAWPAKAVKKPGKFISCSSPDRSLGNLLSIWPQIKELVPEATLTVATPYTGKDESPPENLQSIDGVTYVGSLSAASLYREIAESEYWLNPSDYSESYGLTALEMMKGGVKIISTNNGHLETLLEDKAAIVRVANGETIASATLRTFTEYHTNSEQSKEHLANAAGFAAERSWDKRLEKWLDLFNSEPDLSVKHPELYTYFDDKEAWEQRFVTYAARTKEWELITDEPFDNCFTFPLFTEEFCTKLREEAEHAQSWTTKRHVSFPTTDMVLQVLNLNDTYRAVIADYIMPCAIYHWELGPGWRNFRAETFLAKYTATAQGHLSIHHDESDVTCLIQLSDLHEYEGGGTYFRRQRKVVKNSIGYATLHPGHITHKHGGRAISKGLRYILVSFIHRNRG
ncbi:hypothetical protein AB833_30495 [Chromatiales bacterium (ex Bugula neritina AB1)]|nr:hypothetical protein AB833_30495 [Chromatiales bacterium (ex Bugula neritina AB1)]